MLMAPKNMRSIVMAISLFTTAIAAAIGEAFTALSTNPRFVINYGVFAGLAFVGAIIFWIVFHNLDKEQEDMNLIGQEGYMQESGTNPNQGLESHPTPPDEKAHTRTTDDHTSPT